MYASSPFPIIALVYCRFQYHFTESFKFFLSQSFSLLEICLIIKQIFIFMYSVSNDQNYYNDFYLLKMSCIYKKQFDHIHLHVSFCTLQRLTDILFQLMPLLSFNNSLSPICATHMCLGVETFTRVQPVWGETPKERRSPLFRSYQLPVTLGQCWSIQSPFLIHNKYFAGLIIQVLCK